MLDALRYGLSAHDLPTYASAALALFLLAMLACTIPAWRAWSAEPVAAFRAE